MAPQEAIALHLDPGREFFLPPPTYLIMHGLARFQSSAEVIRDVVTKRYDEGKLPTVDPPCKYEEDGPVVVLRMYLEEGWTHLRKGHYQFPTLTEKGRGSYITNVYVGAVAGDSTNPSKL